MPCHMELSTCFVYILFLYVQLSFFDRKLMTFHNGYLMRVRTTALFFSVLQMECCLNNKSMCIETSKLMFCFVFGWLKMADDPNLNLSCFTFTVKPLENCD